MTWKNVQLRSSCPVLVTTPSPNLSGHVAASQGASPYIPLGLL